MANLLDSLRQHTTVVADTGDVGSMQRYQPTDATTNPSLILKAVQQDAYRPLVTQAIHAHPAASKEALVDHLLVAFGLEILKIVPGRVSTEVDARLSFQTRSTIDRARQIMALYARAGVGRERVLIKIAATWEGIQAARVLETEGIHCNLTLLFSLPQAVACADAGVRLISPFVGRIYDWHKKHQGTAWDEAANSGRHDPGVQSVTKIYNYFKYFGVKTEIMGASFRNPEQILALAGCDLLTISTELLGILADTAGTLSASLSPAQAHVTPPDALLCDEQHFRFLLNEDAMASEKLAEGIRAFVSDARKLDALLDAQR